MSSKIQITESNRFSIVVKNKKDPRYPALEAWQKWFTQRGIPSVIARTISPQRQGGIALYREGLLQIDINDNSVFKMSDNTFVSSPR